MKSHLFIKVVIVLLFASNTWSQNHKIMTWNVGYSGQSPVTGVKGVDRRDFRGLRLHTMKKQAY
ncbi:MAG: hypothetical protein GY874_22100 [Desulfobacteraceae bacterium]|nr:hypothetical protein [Desulfobacteraceae bacterium]